MAGGVIGSGTNAVKRSAWRVLYGRWPRRAAERDGYTILIPVPGDLPVFTHLALAGLARQDATDRAEIIVIPDRITPEFEATFQESAAQYPPGAVRIAPIAPKGRALQRVSGQPYLNHFLQVFHGTNAARTRYALLHDVDLFINDVDFFARRYRRCRDDDLAWLGLELAHDAEWYEGQGVGPVLATWELMFDLEWVRHFPPWQVHGHRNAVNGAEFVFDTMDYPQVHTPRERRRLDEAPGAFVHFRWVITVFRHFQRANGQPYEDHRFRLLLIRLLTDSFGGSNGNQVPPPVEQLARGIADSTAAVTYRSRGLEENYSAFRRMLASLTEHSLIERERAEQIEHALAPFDAAFG